MGIFSGIARIFGNVQSRTKNDVVVVTGIPAGSLTLLMAKWLKMPANKLCQNMFLTIKASHFSFYAFYALEVVSILEGIINHPNTTYKIKRIARKVIDSLETSTWISKRNNPKVKPMIDLSLLKRLKWVPQEHQMKALHVYGDMVPRYDLKGYYMAAQPGTGKTFYDIALATVLIPQELAEVKVIISPKNAIETVWKDTIEKCFVKEPTHWVSNVSGDPPLGKEYYVFHYEAMGRAIDLCKKLIQKGKKYFVIIDEAHNFNSLSSNRTNQLVNICQHARGPYSIWASGSPIKAIGAEIIPFLKCVDPLFIPAVEPGFKKIFGGYGSRANEIVHKRFGLFSHKIPSSEVQAIPKPTPYRVPVKIPNPTPFLIDTVREDVREYVKERIDYYKKNMEEYKEKFKECVDYHSKSLKTVEEKTRFTDYEKDLLFARQHAKNIRAYMDVLGRLNSYENDYLIPSLTPQLKAQFKTVKTVIKALALKVYGEAIGQVYTKRKAECSIALSKYSNLPNIIDQGLAKTIIFSNWTEPLLTAEEDLKKKGYKPIHVYGKDSKNVSAIIKEFTENPDVNPILATYAALSTAVPVTAANQVVMLDYPYREYIYSQSVARAARLGQVNEVFVYELALDTDTVPNVSTSGIDICEFTRKSVGEILGEEFGGFTEEDYSVMTVNSKLPLEMNKNVKAKPVTALGVLKRVLGIK